MSEKIAADNGTAKPTITLERAAWFRRFGYTGAEGEEVTLRDGLGTTSADVVWRTYCGLAELQTEFNGQFHRAVGSAYADVRPVDPADRLSTDEFGRLTDYRTREWLQPERIAVLALTVRDNEGMVSFADTPLVAPAKAA